MTEAKEQTADGVVDTTAEFERAAVAGSGVQEAGGAEAPRYVLRLYVAGTTPRSVRAIATVRRICEDYLKSAYDLEVIDLYQQPALAAGEQIIAAPTLIKKLPAPLRRVIGDMSDESRLLVGLDLRPRDGSVGGGGGGAGAGGGAESAGGAA